ncbi:hypothetical protein SLA2020_138000 [Shorea laevis]
MADEVEVKEEVEAVQAVYGDDCVVIDSYPPDLHLHIKPRTADVSSQQFVEAVVGIQAGPEYPDKPPHIHLIDSKGLDEKRQKHLLSSIQDKACELTSCLMLVALCEEAVERLSVMNHPDGDCPLCLYPLVSEGDQSTALPFMKLMSCFHCFHSECIIRWWNWLQTEKDVNTRSSSAASLHSLRDSEDHEGEKSIGNCPVCRKDFHAKDLEHVLDLVDTHSSQPTLDGSDTNNDEILQFESENIRRQKFEAILKIQEESSGLIEPKRNIVVLPGMYLQNPVTMPVPASTEESTEQQQEQQQGDTTVPAETNSGGSSNRPSTSKHRNSGTRRYRGNNSRKQVRQWVKKDNGSTAG